MAKILGTLRIQHISEITCTDFPRKLSVQCLHKVSCLHLLAQSPSVSALTRFRRPRRARSVRASGRAEVVVTREKGKNGALLSALESKGICCLEMPLIETAVGPERDQLPEVLRTQQFDWIAITSPEAAAVFLEGWKEAGSPQVRVTVVGSGTGKVLEAAGCSDRVEFTPSRANAVTLSAELPQLPGGNNRVLYPSSSKAGSDLQTGLTARGFSVLRLATYDTLPVASISEDSLQQARQASVAAFASPSAVKAWVRLLGKEDASKAAIACIGSTSARAAEGLGLERIFYPEQPGLDGFVDSIMEALGDRARVTV